VVTEEGLLDSLLELLPLASVLLLPLLLVSLLVELSVLVEPVEEEDVSLPVEPAEPDEDVSPLVEPDVVEPSLFPEAAAASAAFFFLAAAAAARLASARLAASAVLVLVRPFSVPVDALAVSAADRFAFAVSAGS
jgi:hypothetical protein